MMHIAGVDEAGRGPWAGPVVAAAVVLPDTLSTRQHPWLQTLRDSKKLSAKKRAELYARLMALHDAGLIGVGFGNASVVEIETLNILQATLLAMRRAVLGCSIPPNALWVDGLQLPNFTPEELKQLPPTLMTQSRTFVGGDNLHRCIAAASVLAKVTRDHAMVLADEQYPQYGFAQHKGYGTEAHQQALNQHGICPLHRKTFAPIKALLQNIALHRARKGDGE